jgi:ATP synthase protein I
MALVHIDADFNCAELPNRPGFARTILRFAENKPSAPPMSLQSGNRWDDDAEMAANEPWQKLTREQVAALRAKEPPLSPWWVVAAQFAVGLLVALLAGLITGRREVAWSALYGAAVVVVPGALMARGMTSRLSRLSAMSAAVSFVSWQSVKIAVSLVMLMLAARIVQPLVWPALLVALVLCLKVYWVALLWRRQAR